MVRYFHQMISGFPLNKGIIKISENRIDASKLYRCTGCKVTSTIVSVSKNILNKFLCLFLISRYSGKVSSCLSHEPNRRSLCFVSFKVI
jgi:hypothetical protein